MFYTGPGNPDPGRGDNGGMDVSVTKIRGGVGLAAEIVKAADIANNADGKTSRAELKGILDGEGYRKGHIMRRGTHALHSYAYRIAGSTNPGEKSIDVAARRTVNAIERAAAKDGKADVLSRDEFQTLSPTAKRLAQFSARYGESTLDELFF